MEIKEIDVETTHEPLVSPVPNKPVLPAPPDEPALPAPTRQPDPEKVPAGV